MSLLSNPSLVEKREQGIDKQSDVDVPSLERSERVGATMNEVILLSNPSLVEMRDIWKASVNEMKRMSHPSLSLLKESEKGEAPSNVVKIS